MYYIYILTSNFQLEVRINPNSRATDQLYQVLDTALHAPHKTFSTLTSNFVTKSNPLNFIRVRHNTALQIQNSKFSPNAQLLSPIAYSVPQSNSNHLTLFTFPTVYLASSLTSPEGPTGATCETIFLFPHHSNKRSASH